MAQNTLIRSVHDLGLAAWFGGTLMGAAGLNKAAASATGSQQKLDIASEGWNAWTPFNLAAIGAYLTGGTLLTFTNKGRIGGQKGVASVTIAKAVASGVALGVTALGKVSGKTIESHSGEPVKGVTEPGQGTSDTLSFAQKNEKWLQWAIPAAVGSVIVLTAKQGEQQRPTAVLSGLAERLAR